ncbi:MAG: acyl-[Lachnospiraceae bacterium]|nr:acyl-[acyl-carrier-protein] thioesterase [Lachnospiraceae bacterium]
MYSFDGRIRFSEVGEDLLLTPESLIDYYQDCSTFQSEDLGIGLKFLREQGFAWLINYWQIDILRYPALGECVRTGTSPYQLRGFMGLRNFIMETAQGETLALANSVWSLINMDKMQPARIPQFVAERYELFPKFDMEYLPRKIAVPQEGGEPCTPVQVQQYHLDTNHHVNNGQYLRMASALLPEGAKPRRIRIAYQRQAVLGDEIIPVRYRTGEDTVLVALDGIGGSPYAAAEFVMTERTE